MVVLDNYISMDELIVVTFSTLPTSRKELHRICSGFDIKVAHNFIMTLSYGGSRDLINLTISTFISGMKL